MANNGYDFSGWATKFGVKCGDGRTIMKDAFKANDGQVVPLVWMHKHDSPENVMGHAKLEARDGSIYAYCTFNDTPQGKTGKALVEHGDVTSLSIYANQLAQKSGNVYHGNIREVSLVLAGANPGAFIDNPVIKHGDEVSYDETEGAIYNDEELDFALYHADDKADDNEDDNEDEEEDEEDSDKKEDDDMAERTVKDVIDSMTEEQRNVMYALIAKVMEGKGGSDDDEDDEEMKHNVFENDYDDTEYLSHSDMQEIFADAKRCGSLKEAVENTLDGGVLMHAVTNADGTAQSYGIANVDYLFPDYKTLNNVPEFIKRPTEWVAKVMGGVKHSPFSRVKSVFANITMDEARAKGYMKGNRKADEVFSLLKRTTDPQTVYKKQRMDRDDIIDITDFDVVAWLKSEMRMMLDEELARAFLIGDGRLASSEDKISESHIRSIWHDDPLYTITKTVNYGATATDADKAKLIIRELVKARKDYRGSGNLVFFTTEDWVSEMMLLEDGIGHRLYADENALARAMRVSSIVTVPVMENLVNPTTNNYLAGIAVDLKDYNVGADKGGAVNMFDDFDIDYNQQKYLIETRCSAALVKPYSAIVVEVAASAT